MCVLSQPWIEHGASRCMRKDDVRWRHWFLQSYALPTELLRQWNAYTSSFTSIHQFSPTSSKHYITKHYKTLQNTNLTDDHNLLTSQLGNYPFLTQTHQSLHLQTIESNNQWMAKDITLLSSTTIKQSSKLPFAQNMNRFQLQSFHLTGLIQCHSQHVICLTCWSVSPVCQTINEMMVFDACFSCNI